MIRDTIVGKVFMKLYKQENTDREANHQNACTLREYLIVATGINRGEGSDMRTTFDDFIHHNDEGEGDIETTPVFDNEEVRENLVASVAPAQKR